MHTPLSPLGKRKEEAPPTTVTESPAMKRAKQATEQYRTWLNSLHEGQKVQIYQHYAATDRWGFGEVDPSAEPCYGITGFVRDTPLDPAFARLDRILGQPKEDTVRQVICHSCNSPVTAVPQTEY